LLKPAIAVVSAGPVAAEVSMHFTSVAQRMIFQNLVNSLNKLTMIVSGNLAHYNRKY